MSFNDSGIESDPGVERHETMKKKMKLSIDAEDEHSNDFEPVSSEPSEFGSEPEFQCESEVGEVDMEDICKRSDFSFMNGWISF